MQRRMVPRRIATAVLTSMSLILAFAVQRPALARSDAEILIDSAAMNGAGPTFWDGNTSDGCELSGFTPVDDGEWKSRDDAFDGGLVAGVDGSAFTDPNDYAPFPNGNTWATGPDTLGTTRVVRSDRALQTSPTMQSLITLKNTDSVGHTITFEWDSNLGSDSFESVHGSSSGDTTYTLGDRWVVSSDSSQTDPVLTFVFFGRRAAEQTDTIVDAPGSGCMTVTFSVHLAPGATKYMLFFTEMNGSNSSARHSAAKFDSVAAGSPLLTGISSSVQHKIANWDL